MSAPVDFAALIDGEDESFQQQGGSTAEALPNANSPMVGRGPLLEEPDEKKVAHTITQWLKDQSKARKRHRVIVAWIKQSLKGVRGLQLRPNGEDITDIELYRAPVNLGLSTVMADARRLIERIVSHLLSDPPVLEAEPEDDSDVAKEAAEVASRILAIEGAESGYNLAGLLRRAVRKSSYYGSSFLYPCIDPTGGGWRPMSIEALSTAQTVQDATIDPATRAPVAKGDPRLKNRYVRPDQSLTDKAAEAERQWMPKIHVEVLTPEHVALLPEQCSGIAGAIGAIVIRYPRISEAREKFTAFKALDDADVRALLGWRPEDMRGSPFDSNDAKQRNAGSSDQLDDQARICTLSLYFKSHAAYPTGAYIVVCGDRVLHRQPWSGMAQQGENVVEECLEIPLAQCRQIDDDEDDDPMGRGFAYDLCENDEQTAYIVNAWNDHLDRILRPHIFLPLGSTIQPRMLETRTGTPIPFNPQGKPEQERVDPFPADGKEFYDRLKQHGDDIIGIQDSAAGQEVGGVNSGVHAAIEVQQSNLNLSSLKHNLADCAERFGRIVIQQWRVFYTIPMQAKYLGDDETWRTTEWSRADLGSTSVVRIKPGTFTQLTSEQKEAKADKQLTMQVISQNQYREVVSSGVRPTLGLKTDPHLIRVKRQISLWDDGPPEGWQPPQPPMMMGPMGPVPAVDPMTGQPLPPPVDPANPFADERQADLDPVVARTRYDEMLKHQAEARYIRQHPAWRGYFDVALNKSRHACGAYTLAEQQAAQAQQQQQQQANEAQDAEAADSRKQAGEERKLQLTGSQRMAENRESIAVKADQANRRAQQMTGAPAA